MYEVEKLILASYLLIEHESNSRYNPNIRSQKYYQYDFYLNDSKKKNYLRGLNTDIRVHCSNTETRQHVCKKHFRILEPTNYMRKTILTIGCESKKIFTLLIS
jgi:hypothetical protein